MPVVFQWVLWFVFFCGKYWLMWTSIGSFFRFVKSFAKITWQIWIWTLYCSNTLRRVCIYIHLLSLKIFKDLYNPEPNFLQAWQFQKILKCLSISIYRGVPAWSPAPLGFRPFLDHKSKSSEIFGDLLRSSEIFPFFTLLFWIFRRSTKTF